MENFSNVTLLSKPILTSVLKNYESELNQISFSPSVNSESALYGLLLIARNCIQLALNHIDELK